MRIAIVVQRYGRDVLGGAEMHAREVAEALYRYRKHEVCVFTTTAESYVTWANHYPPGESSDRGVRIRRFPTRMRRHPRLFGLYMRICYALTRRLRGRPGFAWFVELLEWLFIFLQGPYSPALLRAIRAAKDDFDFFIFFTYLYGPTVHGLPIVADRAILIPEAHDEPPFYFDVCRRPFRLAKHVLANVDAEISLITSAMPDIAAKVKRLGIGITFKSLAELDSIPTPQRHRSNRPYFLYLGRISRGKGVDELISHFTQTPGLEGYDLLLTGRVDGDFTMSTDPRVRVLGFVDEQEKASLLRHAAVVVVPSPMESLSILLIEAVSMQRPVIVNGHSPVLLDYTRHLSTVRAYRDLSEFQTCSLWAATTFTPGTATADSLADLTRSAQWVREQFSWEHVLSTLDQILASR